MVDDHLIDADRQSPEVEATILCDVGFEPVLGGDVAHAHRVAGGSVALEVAGGEVGGRRPGHQQAERKCGTVGQIAE
jgi:hypothetical protein